MQQYYSGRILLSAALFLYMAYTLSGESLLSTDTPGSSTGNFSCYKCNSYHAPTCADWFNNRTWKPQACSPQETMCRKIVQEAWYDDHWNVRYIRQCAERGVVGYDEGRRCVDRIGTYRVKTRYCHCDNKDGCNPAGRLALSACPVAVTLFLALLRLFR